MGRRWAASGSRRPILDIGDAVREAAPPAVAPAEEGSESEPNPLLGLIGDYGDDDEDGDGASKPQQQAEEQKEEPGAASVEDRVAGFLAELEEQGVLPTDGGALPTDSAVLPIDGMAEASGTHSDLAETATGAADVPPSSAPAWSPWQRCLDPASNAYYFWNTQTNEVRWTDPNEVRVSALNEVLSSDPNEVSLSDPNEVQSSDPDRIGAPELAAESQSSAFGEAQVTAASTTPAQAATGSETDAEDKPPGVACPGADQPNDIAEASPPPDDEALPASAPLIDPPERPTIGPPERPSAASVDSIAADADAAAAEPPVSATNAPDSRDEEGHADAPEADAPVDAADVPAEQHISSAIEDGLLEKITPALEGFASRLPELLKMLSPAEGYAGEPQDTERARRLSHQLETRQEDWTAGALSSSYIWEKLQLASQELKKLEAAGLPEGWTRAWDEESSGYYFAKPATGEASWDAPLPPEPDEPPPLPPDADAEASAAACGSGSVPESTTSEVQAPPDDEWVQLTSAKAAMHPERLATLQSRIAAVQEQEPSEDVAGSKSRSNGTATTSIKPPSQPTTSSSKPPAQPKKAVGKVVISSNKRLVCDTPASEGRTDCARLSCGRGGLRASSCSHTSASLAACNSYFDSASLTTWTGQLLSLSTTGLSMAFVVAARASSIHHHLTLALILVPTPLLSITLTLTPALLNKLLGKRADLRPHRPLRNRSRTPIQGARLPRPPTESPCPSPSPSPSPNLSSNTEPDPTPQPKPSRSPARRGQEAALDEAQPPAHRRLRNPHPHPHPYPHPHTRSCGRTANCCWLQPPQRRTPRSRRVQCGRLSEHEWGGAAQALAWIHCFLSGCVRQRRAGASYRQVAVQTDREQDACVASPTSGLLCALAYSHWCPPQYLSPAPQAPSRSRRNGAETRRLGLVGLALPLQGGMVNKWNAVRAEVKEEVELEEEARRPLSLDELEHAKRQRLAEWKEQLSREERKRNTNFQPLAMDWRERVAAKRRKT